ncbi:hypothetical protein ARMGADRAFT_1018987 [Armillaria gallica]|uniref:Uncharacterized protein n=1 Tax=Armillaria gallica TaxID=47427 RepID=A0A2H3D5M6_ARMGA|nr:hypothetical protein ARMGADRAFT_1018987 [Armillaria gallica]
MSICGSVDMAASDHLKGWPFGTCRDKGWILGKVFTVQSILEAKILSLAQLNDTRWRENMHAWERMQSDGKEKT